MIDLSDIRLLRKAQIEPGASPDTLRDLVRQTARRALSEVGVEATEAEGYPTLTKLSLNTWRNLAKHYDDPAEMGRLLDQCRLGLTDALLVAVNSGALDVVSGEAARSLGLDFEVPNPFASSWAGARSAALVTNVRLEVAETVRRETFLAVEGGWAPILLAKRLSRVVGILPAHQAAVDRAEKSAVASGMAPGQARTMADAYADRLRMHRATVIARNELLTSHNQGQHLAWQANVRNGLLPATTRRVWIVTRSDRRTCRGCRTMTGDRAVADMDGYFDTPWGVVTGPPAHVQCRCAQGLMIDGLHTEREIADLLAPWDD